MFYFVVNNQSGRGKKVWEEVKVLLIEHQLDYKVTFIRLDNEYLTRLEKEIVRLRPKALVIVGGDGTIHHCLEVLTRTGTPLGIIPAGSGNDYVKGLKIPSKTNAAFQLLLTGEVKEVDLITMNNHLCATIVGIGLDAMITHIVQNSNLKKNLNLINLGKFSYIFGLFKSIFKYKPINAEITINNEREMFQNVWLIAVANTSYYGGGLKICPDANETNRSLNVCIIHSLSKLQLLTLFPLAFFGKHVILKGVLTKEGTKLTIKPQSDVYIQGDGEVLQQNKNHLHFSIDQTKLKVIRKRQELTAIDKGIECRRNYM